MPASPTRRRCSARCTSAPASSRWRRPRPRSTPRAGGTSATTELMRRLPRLRGPPLPRAPPDHAGLHRGPGRGRRLRRSGGPATPRRSGGAFARAPAGAARRIRHPRPAEAIDMSLRVVTATLEQRNGLRRRRGRGGGRGRVSIEELGRMVLRYSSMCSLEGEASAVVDGVIHRKRRRRPRRRGRLGAADAEQPAPTASSKPPSPRSSTPRASCAPSSRRRSHPASTSHADAVPRSFVDEAFSWRHTDLLFTALFADRPALVYVLFEHQSTVDPRMPFRLLRYMIRIWEAHLAPRTLDAAKLPVIMPLVLHHGEGGWRAAVAFEDLLDIDAELLAEIGAYVPRFRFVLDDLAATTDEAIRRAGDERAGSFRAVVPQARAAARLFKHEGEGEGRRGGRRERGEEGGGREGRGEWRRFRCRAAKVEWGRGSR